VIARLIDWSLHNRVFVLMLTAMLTVGGLWALNTTPIDAIPDLSDVQVIVITDVPGQAPQVVEDQVTTPLSTAMMSVPFARDVRGYSFFGFSLVYVIFEDGTDLYWARSRVLEYLNTVGDRLPEGVTPRLGPDATAVGWVYEYTLTDSTPRARLLRAQFDVDGSGRVEADELPSTMGASYGARQLAGMFSTDDDPDRSAQFLLDAFDKDGKPGLSRVELLQAANFDGIDLAELRSLQDYFLRYDLMSLDGVSEIAAVGGFIKQYQVEVDPEKLRAYGVTLGQVKTAIQRANQDVGGGLIEMAETEYMVRSAGYIRSVDDLLTIPIKVDAESHVPVLLRQVARVVIGPEVRRGIVEMNGQGEVVTGIVLMRYGENALDVIEGVKNRLEELKPGLPPGVEIHVSYDRSKLIHRAIDTLRTKLLEELVVVALICGLFLLHARSALVAIVTLPIGVLATFLLMRLAGINANIMSLGGIAIAVGVMVDASVVMVENLHKHREKDPDGDPLTVVSRAAREVGPALFFSLLIVMVSFVPVFTLEQQEGRLFGPLAWTKTFAMGASALLSVTLIPVLMFLFVRGKTLNESANPLSRFFIWVYRPLIRGALAAPWLVILLATLVAAATAWPLSKLGSEFMPPLNEGDLLYMPTTPPGLSITKAKELLQQTDKLIVGHPQVEHVLGKIGRADTATDPAPLTMIETTILLTDPATWPEGKTIEDIARELDQRVQFPGLTNAWTMPIKTRIDMLATGIKTPVGIKLLGDDLDVLNELGQQIEAVVAEVPGAASVYSERVVGGNFIDITVRREDAARFGLNVADVQDIVKSAIGGMNVTWTVEGLARYPVNVRFPRELRNDLDSLARVAVPTPMGHTVPLAQVADIEVVKGAPAIKSENAKLTAWIYVDLDTSDIGGFVKQAKAAVDAQVVRPPGVSIKWSGQYEYMQRANEKLALVVPLTLGIIFVLLYLHFNRVSETLMVMVGTIVFAPIGGIWFLYLADFNLSVAVGVGFIALAGLAAETGVVMLVYLEGALNQFREEGRLDSIQGLKQAITSGAVDRVRPKLMTVTTTIIGLLPILYGTETGTRVMKRIAAPMVGGLLSSTVLTLVVLPAMYLIWKRFELRKALR
jgi:Cu(I)/Ag(I) efflux system membrane protein CusA/SilA